MPITSRAIDHQAVLDFIVEQQQSPATACAYLGTDAESIKDDLKGLDQPWTETLHISTAEDGRLTGAVVIEWDEELARSWVYGPWMEQDAWVAHGPALLGTVTSLAPVGDHEMYADVAHREMAELATRCGWRHGEANFEYSRTAPVPANEPDPQIRPATAEDLPRVRALHDAEFPGTYASAVELLDRAGRYSTLVLDDGDGVRGYVAYQHQGRDGVYLDFITVDPTARRAGIGELLITAAHQCTGRQRIELTVDENRAGARAFYEALGFDQVAATRPYRSPRPNMWAH